MANQDDSLQDDLVSDDTQGDNELVIAEKETKKEEGFSDPIGSHEAGDELIDENEEDARGWQKGVEGEDDEEDSNVSSGMHIVNADEDRKLDSLEDLENI
jgi:hypothetical protein